MSIQKIIERFGALTKEELLTCLDSDLILPNTCVIEADAPFAGYYSEMPHASKPHYLYCMLGAHHSFESVMRANQSVRAKYKKHFDAALATISVYGSTCQSIRIRNLQNFSDISLLQQYYQDEGISLNKKTRQIKSAMAIIRLKKFFFLEVVAEGLYMDRAEPHHGYFVIPSQIDWGRFKDITREVKFDPKYFHFDGATCHIYENEHVIDMIRIYREHITTEELMALRQKYYRVLGIK